MSEPVKAEGDYRVVSTSDFDAESPRWGAEIGTMVCHHRDYVLGDQHVGLVEEIYTIMREQGYAAALARFREEGVTVALPLYLYDHSGLSMTAGANLLDGHGLDQNRVQWDTSMVGVIFATAANLEGTGILDESVEDILRGEVAEYDMYLRGEVYLLSVQQRVLERVVTTRVYPDGEVEATTKTQTVWHTVPDAAVMVMYGSDGLEEAASEMLSEYAVHSE